MANPELDQLAINTIRTLAMDAVQQANSGHPGTPMAMAPVAYCLWQRFLRFDPEDPIWPNRDRFVLSAGHASMLLYSPAAPDRRQGGQPAVRAARDAVGHARRHQALPPARQQVPGPPRVPLDLRRRDHHRPARPGRRHQRRHGDRAAAGSASTYNRPGFPMFDYDVYALCGDGCMMEGISQRGRLARRASQAVEPVLDLRQQPHHHRGQHRARLQRRRGDALHRLRLERDARRRRQRPRHARARLPTCSRTPTTGRR